jgi:hypothetical protein
MFGNKLLSDTHSTQLIVWTNRRKTKYRNLPQFIKQHFRSHTGYTAANGKITFNDEMGRTYKKAVLANFKITAMHFPEGTQENH